MLMLKAPRAAKPLSSSPPLTYMPTSARLVIAGLKPIEIPYEGPGEPWRHLYGPDDFIRTLEQVLSADEESSFGSDLRLPDQLDNLFEAFVSGRRLYHDREFHTLSPESESVWELKTPDLRVFGWFLKRDHFACMSLMKADAAKGAGEFAGHDALYSHIRSYIVRRRQELGCQPKLCVIGSEPYDVVSVRDRL